jgi:hypothetical protein
MPRSKPSISCTCSARANLTRSARRVVRVLAGVVGLGFGLASLGASALAADGAPTAADSSGKPKGKSAKGAGKSVKTAKKKKAAPAPPPESTEKPAFAKRRRIGAGPAYVVGDSDAHLINDAAPPIEAFPSDAPAVKKAFAETRREQLADAEKAARDEKSPDRWRTVLFMLRGLPERTDSEACFWRVLAFYRLGEIPRARALREGCDLASKDSAALNAEDASASGVPRIGTVAFDDGFGPTPGATNAKAEAPAPPAETTSAPYTGPSPQKK